MGGAVFASLDGQSNFATVPERVQLALRGSERPRRHRPQVRPPAAAERVQQPAPGHSRHPDQPRRQPRDRARPRLRARRQQSRAVDLRTVRQHPGLQPAADAGRRGRRPARRRPTKSPDAEVDAEVSFVTADLANVLPRAKIAAVLSIDDVLGRVREAANWTGSAPSRHLAPELPRGTRAGLCGRRESAIPMPASRPASRRKTSPCCRRRRRKPPAAPPGTSAPSPSARAKSVASVLRELGARPDDIKAITAALGRSRPRRRRAREPQAPGPAGADRRSQIHAADPGRDRERQRHRGGRRLVRSRPLRAGRHPQPRDRSRPRRVSSSRRKRRTTAAACGSTRASTRPRCATRCRAR